VLRTHDPPTPSLTPIVGSVIPQAKKPTYQHFDDVAAKSDEYKPAEQPPVNIFRLHRAVKDEHQFLAEYIRIHLSEFIRARSRWILSATPRMDNFAAWVRKTMHQRHLCGATSHPHQASQGKHGKGGGEKDSKFKGGFWGNSNNRYTLLDRVFDKVTVDVGIEDDAPYVRRHDASPCSYTPRFDKKLVQSWTRSRWQNSRNTRLLPRDSGHSMTIGLGC